MKTCKDVSMTDAEKRIMRWLRNSTDRDGGRKDRAQKKIVSELNNTIDDDN